MAETMGMGVCLIYIAPNRPCGRQIQEGEPIGTVVLAGGPVVGHKKCADNFRPAFAAVANAGGHPVKLGKQGGPGGAIPGPEGYDQAIAGSIPLESVTMPEGVKSLADLPMDGEPAAPVEAAPLPPRARTTKARPRMETTEVKLEGTRDDQRGRVTLGGTREDRRRQLREAMDALDAEPDDTEIVYHDIHLDMAEVPRETEVIRIHLDLRNITD